MGRHSLRIVMVLGVLVTLVGGTGIFAAFTDRATTGQNSVQSGPRQVAADLRIALASLTGGIPDCDPDNDGLIGSDDLTTGILSASAFQPGSETEPVAVCLFNAGAGHLAITTSVIDLVDTDTACTGDEAAAGDSTCGSGQAGELSTAVAVRIDALDCQAGVSDPIQSETLSYWLANPVPLPGLALAPGAIACVQFVAYYPLTTLEFYVQVAQSDLVEWRFAFDASAN